MAANRWRGGCLAIAQLNTITVGGTAAGAQVYSVTINSKIVSYTASGGDSNTSIATALFTLLAASTIPEFGEVIWANPSAGIITGTAKTAGLSFTNTSAATGTGTLVTVVTTANTGPGSWTNALNWSTGSVPVTGDDVTIDYESVPITDGLAQSAVTLNSLTITAAFTGTIGLPENNVNGYYEYRLRYLTIGSTTTYIGTGPGNGSPQINLDNSSITTTLNVSLTGTSTVANLEPLQWKGTNAANVVNINRGVMAIAGYGGDVATVATLNTGYVSDVNNDAQVRCGLGTTLTTISMVGGQLLIDSGATTITMTAGLLYVGPGTGINITTLNIIGGTCYYTSTGTVGTTTVGAAGVLDCSQDTRGRTFTTMTFNAGSGFKDPRRTVSWTTQTLLDCGIEDLTAYSLGKNIQITRVNL